MKFYGVVGYNQGPITF